MPVSVIKSVEASASTHGWIPLNTYEPDSQVSLLFTTPGGDWEGTIQGTLDDVMAGASAVGFDLVTITGSATSYVTALSQPLNAIRINITSASAGSVGVLRLLQSGK